MIHKRVAETEKDTERAASLKGGGECICAVQVSATEVEELAGHQ